MGFGLLSMVLIWAVLILGGLFVVRWLMGQGSAHREDSALEILKKRYARGEIDKQEFEERKRDLLA
jgi:putative membrane protein